MKIEIGDVIRSKKPYFGQPAYIVVGLDQNEITTIWGNSKYGPVDWNTCGRETLRRYDLKHYKKIGKIEKFYLWVIGNTYGRLRKFIKYSLFQ